MNHKSQEAALGEALEAVVAAVHAVRGKKEHQHAAKELQIKKKKVIYSSTLLPTCMTGSCIIL